MLRRRIPQANGSKTLRRPLHESTLGQALEGDHTRLDALLLERWEDEAYSVPPRGMFRGSFA
jgi:hypothetical protein